GAKIQLTLPTQSVYIYADRTMFRQALLNLLTNGLDQVTGGVVGIDVGVEGHEVRLRFALHGAEAGTAAKRSTAHRCTKREGIGLEVAIQLFQMQNLHVNVGTQADLWPVEVRMAQSTPQQILVIDDMPDIPQLFQRFTSACAIDVISAAGGDEALALLQQVTPALILLDVMLPRRDGWEILQTLKANPTTAAIPVVICSILNEPGLALALGADSYLPKPVSQEALLNVLAKFLQPFPEPAGGRL
ncbi:MAG: response regulator, partial [Caldilineaceae bacterium]|nr:response regulator [Caldilineaceae bacterium]